MSYGSQKTDLMVKDCIFFGKILHFIFGELDFCRLTNVVLYCLFIELYLDSKQQCYKDLGFKRYNNILLVACLSMQ